ncbi:putative methyltransferase [Cesiribacter andamanensis AMV16]|uniref:Putative methyltransferase n=2 Tax=Cesiribacter TaxID=1133570 RepID=M7NRJ4_9BACT|nr:RNA methyltransferase [Cesiribacter andamanensis]EMR04300.1 putative methyltransferase [Cesiribacter andamanensis AMV16]
MFLEEHADILSQKPLQLQEASPTELDALGTLQTNHTALAVVEMQPNLPLQAGPGEWALLLEEVGDPGNLGTIIRIADWYGIRKLICSPGTVDFYNPKVVTSSKGSFTRVQAYYTELLPFLEQQRLPVYGADLQGEPVHSFAFPEGGYLLMGSEAHGISPLVAAKLSGRLTIPAYGQAESLNVAIATAIICDNLRRSQPIRP